MFRPVMARRGLRCAIAAAFVAVAATAFAQSSASSTSVEQQPAPPAPAPPPRITVTSGLDATSSYMFRGIYQEGPGTPYQYWAGINPAAILGMAAGFFTYLYLLDPISYASHWPYQFLTASLPTAFVGGVVYWLATLLIVKPAGTRSGPSTCVISARFAPLPPRSIRSSREPSAKSCSHC